MLSTGCGAIPRVEIRRRGRGFILGLLADLPRRILNDCRARRRAIHTACSTCSPDPVGHRRSADDLRDYVTAHLGDTDAVLVVDETGDLKKGQRQPPSGAAPVHRPPPDGSRSAGRGLPHLLPGPAASDDRPRALPAALLDDDRASDRGGTDPRRRPRRWPAEAGTAAAVGRARREGHATSTGVDHASTAAHTTAEDSPRSPRTSTPTNPSPQD